VDKLKVAVVGAGGIANAYLNVIASGVTDLEVAAIVEPHAGRAGAASANLGVPTFRDIHELVDARASLGIDGLLVCTPPISHVPVSSAALDAGLAVLCEKPLALNRPGLHMMLDAASRADRLVMMAAKYRYVTDVQRTKELIDAGELGEIVLFRNAFTSHLDMADRWNSRAEVAGGGVVIDRGTHSVDIARYLLGPIRHVVATETRRIQPIGVEDTAQILIRTDSGVTGTIDLSWSLGTGSQWYVTIDGTRGSVRLGWDCAEINRGDGWIRFGEGYDRADAFARQLNDFADAVRYGTKPTISTEDAIASVAVIDAAYRSMQTGSWVRVVEDRRPVSVPVGVSVGVGALSSVG
jgi:predicted dehydrogenase